MSFNMGKSHSEEREQRYSWSSSTQSIEIRIWNLLWMGKWNSLFMFVVLRHFALLQPKGMCRQSAADTMLGHSCIKDTAPLCDCVFLQSHPTWPPFREVSERFAAVLTEWGTRSEDLVEWLTPLRNRKVFSHFYLLCIMCDIMKLNSDILIL